VNQNQKTVTVKNLQIRKQVAGGATGAVLGAVVAGPVGALLGGVIGTAVGKVAESGSLTASPNTKTLLARRTVRPTKSKARSAHKNGKASSGRPKQKKTAASRNRPAKASRRSNSKTSPRSARATK
jgi:hypothetical protein